MENIFQILVIIEFLAIVTLSLVVLKLSRALSNHVRKLKKTLFSLNDLI